MIRRILKAGAGAAAICIAAALLYAPYLPRLLWEGYPQATWPAPGTYATVAGGDGLPLQEAARISIPDGKLKALFDGTEGRKRLAVVRFGGKVQLLHSPLYGVGRSIAAAK